MKSPLHQPGPHEAGLRHATGEARYVDDEAPRRGELIGLPVTSPHPRARITRRDGAAARGLPGIHGVYFGDDIPGINDIGPAVHGEPLLAKDEVFYRGQMVALVVGETLAEVRAAIAAVEVDYEAMDPILSVRAAVEQQSFHGKAITIERGEVDAALARAAVVIEGEVESGGQDHFYLETQAALAYPEEDDTFFILSSTQHPTECQAKAAEVLGVGRNRIVVECPRLGGGFGGKESQAAYNAALAVLGAWHTGRPVRVRFDRDLDMSVTGKRHPWYSRYRAGFDADGTLLALDVETFPDGGWADDLSRAILERCLFHIDGAYFVEHLRVVGHIARTNLPSNTAFRGFGGPQGMVVVEDVMSRASEQLGLDPSAIRIKNLYGDAPRDTTHFGQALPHNRLGRIVEGLLPSAEWDARRTAIAEHNARHPFEKRGLGFMPVKFGISFTTAFLNQAGALVLVYADGTVQLNHGGTEMGQGLHTKMLAICAHELGVPLSAIRMMNTRTDKIPNTSATAASSGADLNGQAVRDACERLRERLAPVAAGLLGTEDASAVRFEDGVAHGPGGTQVPFAEVASRAHLDQVPLSATGFYKTPGIQFDWRTGRGTPFYYFAYGGAVVEVEVSGLTGEHRVLRVDILHDVGDALVPSIDLGQVEGGFVQGYGWLTMEELLWSDEGRLLTSGPSTYKVPAVGDVPLDLRVALLEDAAQPGTIHGSKAVGEPPFMLALGVVSALRQAIRAFSDDEGHVVALMLPATPEAILRAVEDARGQPTA